MSRVLSTIVLLLAAAPALAQTQPATMPTTKPLPESALIAQQLADKDVEVQNRAWQRVQQLLAEPVTLNREGRPNPVVDTAWVRSLIISKRFADAERLALIGIERRPFDHFALVALGRARSQALLAAGQHEAALAAAKSFYHVTALKQSAAAADTINAALLKVRPNAKSAAEAFKAQQASGAPPAGENLLDTIKIDPKVYEPAFSKLSGNDYLTHLGRGNLLLMSDRPAEARESFQKALEAAKAVKEAVTAFEGAAKCVRAETGSVAAAQAFLDERLKD